MVYFVRLVELRNFSRVAESEHVTQSAVSQQISRLERTLGVRLFNRTTHQTTVTEEGAALLFRAQGIVDRLALFEETAHSLSRELSGGLRIGSPFQGAQCPERQAVLGRLTDTHPDVELTIHNSWTSELMTGLRSTTLDMIFVNFALPESSTPSKHSRSGRSRLPTRCRCSVRLPGPE